MTVSQREILNHAFSMITFCIALVEFIVLKGFSTSAFFLITAMCLFDVVAGYSLSIIAAKHEVPTAPHDDCCVTAWGASGGELGT